MKLVIAQTWDGQPARADEVATLILGGTPSHLVVRVDAPFHGDPAPDGPPGSFWKLWEHEVVELFVLGAHDHYTEIELGPHGHHVVLRLEGRRNAVAQELPIDFVAERSADGRRWTGTAHISRSLLPTPPHRINATAIHGQGADRRYLSWAPLGGSKPDFHMLERFRWATLP